MFVQRIYGLSMCFGTGVIENSHEVSVGLPPKPYTQYTIKGKRVFYHEGQVVHDEGTFQTWLGASKIVVVPRTEASLKWLKQGIRDWQTLLRQHQELMRSLRFVPGAP